MPAKWIPMQQGRETLRLAFDQRWSQCEMSLALGASQSTVNEFRRGFAASGLPRRSSHRGRGSAGGAALCADASCPGPTPEAGRGRGPHERQRLGMTLQPARIKYKALQPTGYCFTQYRAGYHA